MNKNDNKQLTPGLEDYLEAIYMIEQAKNVSRVKDIASRLDVKAASVTGALQSLAEKKLINYTPYEYITLTESGLIEAKKVADRHNLLKRFFIEVLGIDQTTADQGACSAEHTLGKPIIQRIADFMTFIEENRLSEDIERFKDEV